MLRGGLHLDNAVDLEDNERVFLADFRDETDVMDRAVAPPGSGWPVVLTNPSLCDSVEIVEARVQGFYAANLLIRGTIPRSLSLCTALVHINISDNKLHGPVPDGVGELRQLRTFVANNNRLTGTVPGAFCHCKALNTLTLAGNQLTGEVPRELMRLAALRVLDLYDNQLSNVDVTHSLFNTTMKWCRVNF